MKWHFADINAQQTLGYDPLSKMQSPVLIKENPVRQVFKCNDLYFKYDMRFFNGLKKEFRHAMRISAAGIPVVKHLAVSRHWLITQSAENTVELSSFLRNNVPTDEMLESFGSFIVQMKKSGLKHDDLHAGNILYDSGKNSFMLVDLCSADIAYSKADRQDKNFAHLILELRRYIHREKLFSLLKLCTNQNPETIFDETLNRDTVEILKSWPKRYSQILSGYKKFVRKQDNMIFAADAPCDITGAIKITGNVKKYMLLHHYLELNHIPHQRVFAVDDSNIFLENEPSENSISASAELFADFSERLALCGIASTKEDWIISSGKIKFINLKSAIEQCEILEG